MLNLGRNKDMILVVKFKLAVKRWLPWQVYGKNFNNDISGKFCGRSWDVATQSPTNTAISGWLGFHTAVLSR